MMRNIMRPGKVLCKVQSTFPMPPRAFPTPRAKPAPPRAKPTPPARPGDEGQPLRFLAIVLLGFLWGWWLGVLLPQPYSIVASAVTGYLFGALYVRFGKRGPQ